MINSYMSGINIAKTDPVATKIQQNGEKQMCFYIPAQHQANPPQPTQAGVEVVNAPDTNIFSR